MKQLAAVGGLPGLSEPFAWDVVEDAVDGAVDAGEQVGERDADVDGGREVAAADTAGLTAPQRLVHICVRSNWMQNKSSFIP